MARYVILLHELPPASGRPRHWDLMFEDGATLATWALSRPPLSAECIDAAELPAHRLRYLDYEGPVSGDRGTVRRWDAGEFEWLRRDDHVLEARLDGRLLRGEVTLRRSDDPPSTIAGVSPSDAMRWVFQYTAEAT